MIETVFRSALTSATSVTAIVGTRIYPLVLPTDPTLPAIEFTFVAGLNIPTMDSMGVQKYRVEVNCWGDTYDDAVSLRYAVVKALSGYTSGNSSIQYLMPQDDFDDDLLQYRATAEFYVFDGLQ
jgi:hypothetical protein